MKNFLPENCPSLLHWEKIGKRVHNGINIPLFSLRGSPTSVIGEFLDLLPLINWCSTSKIGVIQLLPINDSGSEPSPYSALSSCALNPIFLSLHKLPHVNKAPNFYSPKNRQRLDYAHVYAQKMTFLKEYVAEFGLTLQQEKQFETFKKNNPWLSAYALFKTLKIVHEGLSWKKWEAPFSYENAELLTRKYEKEVSFHILVQYLCFEQMKLVKSHAKEFNVLLKGDIPILVSSESADTWSSPHLFDFQHSAGAPPDALAKEGQNWGFPLFNWDAIEQEDFAWWRQRLRVASELYDLYRIDHVVGLFRIWAIPFGKNPKEGFYVPQNPDLWIPQGKKILEIFLQSTLMLPIAEDLGTVPEEVRTCLSDLGICGTKVIRWERDYSQESAPFLPLDRYPKLSMTTVSTHDVEPLKLWWKKYPQESKDLAKFKNWPYDPALSTVKQLELLKDSLATPSLFHINLLQEYLSLFPHLSWEAIEDEQINVPGTISPGNWSYRFKPTIDEIVSDPKLKKLMQKIF